MPSNRTRRAPGTGSLIERVDSAGRTTYYAKFQSGGRQVKRRIGPKRPPGSRDGLTRAQAEAEMRKLMSTVTATAPVSVKLDIGTLGARYIEHLRRQGRKRSTIVAVESALRIWLVPTFGNRALDGIAHHDVQDLVVRMEAKALSAKSIRNYIGTLSALFNYAMVPTRGWATHNPCVGVDLPAVPEHTEVRFLTLEQVDAVVAAAGAGPYLHVDRAMYVTAAMTGMRVGELIALRWQDVDWAASRIRVERNYVLGETTTPKSKRSKRSVPMAPVVGGMLDRLAKHAAGKDVPEPHPEALVFADPRTGGELDKGGVLRRFRAAQSTAGIEGTFRFHDLRHTFGTQMAKAGVPMRTLQHFMGHRDIATTQRYADYSPGSNEAAMVAAAFARPAADEEVLHAS
jgi:integrase